MRMGLSSFGGFEPVDACSVARVSRSIPDSQGIGPSRTVLQRIDGRIDVPSMWELRRSLSPEHSAN